MFFFGNEDPDYIETRYEDDHCIIDAEVSKSLRERLAEFNVTL